jgi:hypothetical protein
MGGGQTEPMNPAVGAGRRDGAIGAIFVLAIVAVMLYFICRAV